MAGITHILIWTGDEGCNAAGTFEELALHQYEYGIELLTQIIPLE